MGEGEHKFSLARTRARYLFIMFLLPLPSQNRPTNWFTTTFRWRQVKGKLKDGLLILENERVGAVFCLHCAFKLHFLSMVGESKRKERSILPSPYKYWLPINYDFKKSVAFICLRKKHAENQSDNRFSGSKTAKIKKQGGKSAENSGFIDEWKSEFVFIATTDSFFSENEPQRHIPRSVSTRVTLPHRYTSRKRKDTAKPPRL